MSIHQDPRAYVLGLEGVALLRAFCGDHGAQFTERRVHEVRALAREHTVVGKAMTLEPLTTLEAYAQWSGSYDLPGNGCFELDEPIIEEILSSLPPGQLLDAACGTGRLMGMCRRQGHMVAGVDSSEDMLAVARTKWPDTSVLRGDLQALPVASGSMDAVVCALALSHLPSLSPAMAEFARVLRPGGHLIISDVRGFLDIIRPPMVWQRTDGSFGYVPVWIHRTSDYIAAALAVGLDVRRCDEPPIQPVPIEERSWQVPIATSPGEPSNVWGLMGWCPEAAHSALADMPGAIIWHFQKRE